MTATERMDLLLGLAALDATWETLDDQERMEVFMGLTAPPQWVGITDNASAVRSINELERSGYLRIGWHHGTTVFKLTSKGIEAAQRVMAEPSLTALDETAASAVADSPGRCSWYEVHEAATRWECCKQSPKRRG
jgi:hypothetical protein